MRSSYYLGNQSFEVREEHLPEIGTEDVLVKVAACGVCGTDVHIFYGDKGSAEVNPPVVLGHEFSGVVEQVGKHVHGLRKGDHVTVDPNIYCGKCHYCRIGKKQLCTSLYAIGVNRNGGFAEYCVAPETQCYLLDPSVPLEYGAMAEPLACCIHGIDRAGIHPGNTVCVVGGGAIGLMMVQLARLAGASAVILSEPVAMRREIGLQLGADLAVDPLTENPKAFVERHLGVPGVDVVIECVGNPAASRQSLELTKRGTTVLLFSVPKAGTSVDLSLEDVYQKELRIIGSLINPDTHGRAAALINSGRIILGPILTHRYPLNQVREAIFMQQSNESLKVLIKPDILF